jgi:hypothetical protein
MSSDPDVCWAESGAVDAGAAGPTPAGTDELLAINAELAAVLGVPPAELIIGAHRSLGDSLVVCGILGGKEVGKSTLINALAGQRVSDDHGEIDVGTTRPMAYVHRDVAEVFRRRLAGTAAWLGGAPVRLDTCDHAADTIQNLVLVDLPDFDSDLPGHLETVKAVLPVLDRVIWVLTPRKIADRLWVSLLASVLKDRQNVYCVLNKSDELLGDEQYAPGIPPSFLEDQSAWAVEMLGQAGWAHDPDRLFILAALSPTAEAFVELVGRRWGDPDWSRFERDRQAVGDIGRRLVDQLRRLRNSVLAPVTDRQAVALKQANQGVELRKNAELLKAHYRLDEWTDRLRRTCDPGHYQGLLNEAFGADFCETIGRRLAAGQRPETDLADDLLAARVDLWPILPLMFWPARWLVRRMGTRLAGLRWSAPQTLGDLFRVRGQSLRDRVRTFLARFREDHVQVIQRFQLADCLPDAATSARRVAGRAAALVDDLDQELLAALKRTYRQPSLLKRGLLWLAVIWFPVAQPLLKGFLQLFGAGGKVDLWGGILQIVTALGATHLLVGFLFAAFLCLMILSGMYAQAVRQIRDVRRAAPGLAAVDDSSPLAEQVDQLLITELVQPICRPFGDLLDRLEHLRRRLARLS